MTSPDMPDITDTGTIIGTLPSTSQQVPPPPPDPMIIAPDDENDVDNGIMMKNSNATMEVDLDESGGDEEDALRAIELLRGDDVSGRVSAAHKLPRIAAALGPERTREELLPFLSDGVDDDDRVLEAVASSLSELLPHVGGAEHAACLLPTLELLLAVEEGAVREKASGSAVRVSERMADEAYRKEFVGMLGRLAKKEWFTARISACGLIPLAFPRMGPDLQGTYIEHFANLCRDDAPMVRRIASRNLGPLLLTVVKTLGPPSIASNGVVTNTLLELYELLASGDQPDSVRLHTTENCVSFGTAMTHLRASSTEDEPEGIPSPKHAEMVRDTDGLIRRILPLVVATIDDRSWRVRWTAASKFALVVQSFSPLLGTMDVLVPAYEKLLQDPEAEVRTAATLNLSAVANTGAMVFPPMGEEGTAMMEEDEGQRIPVAERLVKRVMTLTEDDSENVRAALAMVAMDLAPVLGKEATISQLLPPMLLLLRDSTSEVRLNIISSLSLLNEVIGTDLLSQSLLPAILDLAEDGKWRIRLAVIERIPLLAKQLGKDFFNDKLLSLIVGWLGDDIASIRESAAKTLKELTSIFGSEWSARQLVPRVQVVRDHPSYLRRMCAVQAMVAIIMAMDVDTAQLEVLPTLLEAACDVVPNVRFNVAKGLGSVGSLFNSFVYESQILPILGILLEDPDRDVRYFAHLTSESLKNVFVRKKK